VKYGKAVILVTNRPGKWTYLPPLDLYVMFTRTDLWEYVLHGRQEYGFCSHATDVCPARVMCVRSYKSLVVACPRVGMKGKRLLWNDLWMFQACVLGLPCKVESRFRNRPPLMMNETAYPFCHIE
jgi:hypothetical protein